MGIINLENITKVYRMGRVSVPALGPIDLSVEYGEMVAVVGASGSGKSTLLNIIGCLDRPTSGKYMLKGIDVSKLSDNRLAELRSKTIGFVFQDFNLLRRISAVANVELPLVYSGGGGKHQRAAEALEKVGLGNRLNHKPTELSGGEQQRVAIARALINKPSLILADEPTGNLDSVSANEIISIFHGLHQDKITILMITHETDIASHAQRVVRLKDGKVISDEKVPQRPSWAGQER